MRAFSLVLSLAFLFAGLAPGYASAQDGSAVINVLTIDTGGDTQKFLGFAKRAREISAKHDSPGKQRVWLGTLAGEGVGMVTVGVEYPSLVAMAQTQAKLNAADEWQKFIADFNKSGMRVTSNSVYTDISP